jgi:hypothetical protein
MHKLWSALRIVLSRLGRTPTPRDPLAGLSTRQLDDIPAYHPLSERTCAG